MELKLDKTKTYAVALEGGGAKGGYEIGVWKALNEAGIAFDAVSGTSVGALNGALYALGDLQSAIDYWADMSMSKVIDLDEASLKELQTLLSEKRNLRTLRDFFPDALEILKNKGLDISPLNTWIRQVVNTKAIRTIKESGIDFYITTVNLSERKAQVVRMADVDDDRFCDMLLASAYHPTFKLERLGDFFYADGGFVDSLPIYPLVQAGYKDIIAVHIPGIGRTRRFKIPSDVAVHHIAPDADLGNALNFDSKQAIEDMTWGYMDAKRMLYGLYGHRYYLNKTMSGREALGLLLDHYTKEGLSLREITERKIPMLSVQYKCLTAGHYGILTALCEDLAQKKHMNPLRVYNDREFFTEALGLEKEDA